MDPKTCMDLAGDHYARGASVPGQKNTLSHDFQALDSLDSVGQLREAALGVGRWTPERAWTLLGTTMPGVHLSQAKKTTLSHDFQALDRLDSSGGGQMHHRPAAGTHPSSAAQVMPRCTASSLPAPSLLPCVRRPAPPALHQASAVSPSSPLPSSAPPWI